MKYLLYLSLLVLSLSACKEKPCEIDGEGRLCFRNMMDDTRINVHIGANIIFSVDPEAEVCTELIPEGEYEVYVQYERLTSALGKSVYMYPTVVTCKDVTVRVREDSGE